MNSLKVFLTAAIVAAFLSSCEKNDDKPEVIDYSSGIYVVNEGAFGSANGSISFFDPVKRLITNGVFEAANGGMATGDVVQSFALANDTLGVIVANNSGLVRFVDLRTFASVAEPVEIEYPRYFIRSGSNKGYVSCGSFQGYLIVVDLESFSVTDSIQVGFGPENMIVNNGYVYVVNSGGWSVDSTLQIINTSSDEVVETIVAGKMPSDIDLDANENIWVYCKGYSDYVSVDTESELVKIDPEAGTVTWRGSVGVASDYGAVPPKMAVSKDGSKLFYLRPDGVYSMNTSNPVVSDVPLIDGSYYGIEVSPVDGNIFLFEVTSFTSSGKMKIFSETGAGIAEGDVGIAPNGAVFNIN
ncbi:MAG: hypothetical protein JXA72_03255 [Bacteroidales bacterium]|nr:hypothetical protein [Bacteroidales bacterium]